MDAEKACISLHPALGFNVRDIEAAKGRLKTKVEDTDFA